MIDNTKLDHGQAWQAYTKNMSVQDIRKRFIAKYGHAPSRIVDNHTCWLVGPVACLNMFEDTTTGLPVGQLKLF